MGILWLLWTYVTVTSLTNGRLIQTILSAPELEGDENVELLHANSRSKRQTVSTCTDGYEDVASSTMCAVDSPNFIPGSEGVSVSDKQTILDAHNNYRKGVNPTATNMMKVYWDDKLAAIAEKWAKQCYAGHDHQLGLSRYIPPYGKTPGQNAAFAYADWSAAVAGWYNEVDLYTYGEDPEIYIGPGGWKEIGHYTQVVKDTTALIGCGYATCSIGYQKFYICNYLTGQGNVQKPYNNGTSCGDCSTSCSEGKLCDCPDKFCFNGGNMDINACTCTCKFPWLGATCLDHPCNGLTCKNGGTLDTSTCTCTCTPLYSGTECEILTCGEDPSHCGTQWPPSFCTKYSNVPAECPNMCGLC